MPVLNHQLKQVIVTFCLQTRARKLSPWQSSLKPTWASWSPNPNPTLLWSLLKQKLEMHTRKSLGMLARSWCEKHSEALGYALVNWSLQKQTHTLTSLHVPTSDGKRTTRLLWAQNLGGTSSSGDKVWSLFMQLPKTLRYCPSPGIFILWDPNWGTLSPLPVSPLRWLAADSKCDRCRQKEKGHFHSYSFKKVKDKNCFMIVMEKPWARHHEDAAKFCYYSDSNKEGHLFVQQQNSCTAIGTRYFNLILFHWIGTLRL